MSAIGDILWINYGLFPLVGPHSSTVLEESIICLLNNTIYKSTQVKEPLG